MSRHIHSNRLAALAADIRAAHSGVRAAATTAAERAIGAGHLLLEAKTSVPHGQWLPWLREHVEISERVAQGYMRLARNGLKSETVSDLGIKAALAQTAQKRVPFPAAGQVIHGKDGGVTYPSHFVFIWPSPITGFAHVIYFLAPPGAGGPDEVVTLKKPVSEKGLPLVLPVLGFPMADAIFTRDTQPDPDFLEWLNSEARA